MKENLIQEKSFAFAVRIVNLGRYLTEKKKEFIISKQISRAGISIGANICEGVEAESRADFVHKLSISNKETAETMFLLRLLFKTQYISERAFDSLFDDCNEIKKILTAIIKTTKQNPGKN